MTTSSHVPIPSLDAPRRSLSHLRLAANAFCAILGRDVLVTGREFIAFLAQMLLQPLFFLFIFGKVLPGIGLTAPSFSALLLPGIVGLTTVMTAMQGAALNLTMELGWSKEIYDRLLAPLPDELVALEKTLFAAVRGLVGGGIIFPLAAWILGSDYSVRTDRIGLLVLSALMGACLGLFMGTVVPPAKIALMFTLIFTPLLFTGCSFYPWASLGALRWFQIVTLFNPLTYADEGIRYAIVPPLHGHDLATLDLRWVLVGLSVTVVLFGALGTRTFLRRVVS